METSADNNINDNHFCVFGLIFITIGSVVLVYSKKIIEVSERYDSICPVTLKVTECRRNIEITEKMKKPIMVYYQLNNFYQNHRRYVKSKSDAQLHGEEITLSAIKGSGDCSPVETNEQINQSKNYNGDALDPTSVAIPCGLIAKSFFNDTYEFKSPNGFNIPIDQKNIAWKADKDLKYRNIAKEGYSEYWKTVQWIDMTDEHFIV